MANATERALRKKRKRAAAASGGAKGKTFPPHSKKRNLNPRSGVNAKNPNRVLEAKGLKAKKEPKKEEEEEDDDDDESEVGGVVESKDETFLVSTAPASQQLRFFLNRFQAAGGFNLSELELEAIKDTCMVELLQGLNQDVENFSKHVKNSFKGSWKEVLCKRNMIEGQIDAGSPAVLIISASALRSLELLRGLKSLTRDCQPAKLFAKHMKLEEQTTLLKNRVNIATGTPSRIKKLIEVDALGLSRLALLVIDMQRDAKGYSLFTLPQVSNEFWELYKSHFHQRLVQGDFRICFYGPTSIREYEKTVQSSE